MRALSAGCSWWHSLPRINSRCGSCRRRGGPSGLLLLLLVLLLCRRGQAHHCRRQGSGCTRSRPRRRAAHGPSHSRWRRCCRCPCRRCCRLGCRAFQLLHGGSCPGGAGGVCLPPHNQQGGQLPPVLQLLHLVCRGRGGGGSGGGGDEGVVQRREDRKTQTGLSNRNLNRNLTRNRMSKKEIKGSGSQGAVDAAPPPTHTHQLWLPSGGTTVPPPPTPSVDRPTVLALCTGGGVAGLAGAPCTHGSHTGHTRVTHASRASSCHRPVAAHAHVCMYGRWAANKSLAVC